MKTAPRPAPVFATVDAVEEAFYDALNRGDAIGLMSLWADDEECVCVHPSGARHVGWDAIKASWDSLLANGGMTVAPRSRRTYMGAVLVVHNVIEEQRMPDGNGAQMVSFVATNVYSRSPRGWRILMHHSMQTSEEQASLERARSETIH